MTFKARGLYASSSKERGGFRPGPWLFLGALLVAALVVATAAAVLGNVSVDRGGSSDSYAASEKVVIENDTGGEVVLTAGGDQVRVERSMRGSPLSEPEEEVREQGDGLRLEAVCAGIPFFGGCEVDYEVTVPVGTAVEAQTISGQLSAEALDGELDLTSTSGRIRVSDNEGDVTAENVSGQIELSGVRGAVDVESTSGRISAEGQGPSLDADSVAGEVDVSGFDAETVEAETTSGDIRMGGGFTEARVSTVSGGVEVAAEEDFTLLEVESTSGDVAVRLPGGTYDVTGESTSGSRQVEVDTSPEADARVRVDTVSGSLTVSPR